MDLIAYALRAEYEGSVTVDDQQVPAFQGGVLWVGDGDFHVRDTLDAGDGVIVLHAQDSPLVDVLDHYPPLKRVAVPPAAAPVSRYERVTADELRHRASLRGATGVGNASKASLVELLEAHDAAVADGDAQRAEALINGTKPPEERHDSAPPEPEVGELTVEQLVAVLDNDQATFEHAGAIEVPAALEELRARAHDDVVAEMALEERGLLPTDDSNGGGA